MLPGRPYPAQHHYRPGRRHGLLRQKISGCRRFGIILNTARALEVKGLITYWPWYSDAASLTEAKVAETTKRLNTVGQQLRKEGCRFAWHNHDKEFSSLGKTDAFTALVAATDADSPAGRSEALIPAVRKAFGPEMTLYADANSGYGIPDAIRIGRLLANYDYDFFEEPIAFDRYVELKRVQTAVDVSLAGGEQEGSMNNFRYLIGEDVLTYVQPDPFYFGGMIRSTRVARMAAVRGRQCVPHISGSGLGFLYMMHFVHGKLEVPTGPGMGVEIDAAYLAKHRTVE